jgi:hypothetical protein
MKVPQKPFTQSSNAMSDFLARNPAHTPPINTTTRPDLPFNGNSNAIQPIAPAAGVTPTPATVPAQQPSPYIPPLPQPQRTPRG